MLARFPKKERINRKKDFELLIQKGNVLRDDIFRLYYVRSENDHSALGIAVPKKIIHKAVDRNLLKRRIREVYRKNRPDEFPYMLLCVYNAAKLLSYKDIEISLKKHFRKIQKE